MAWEDDPVQYSSANGVTTATWGSGGKFAPGTYDYLPSNAPGADANGYAWYPRVAAAAVPPPTPAPEPPPPAPHLQFRANVIGSPIPLAYGSVRLAGQLIWAAGIDASTDNADTSYLTFCSAYCEPIDASEPVRIQRMWANGTLFYDYNQGGVITVASMDASAMDALQTCINGMEYHAGGPAEIPSPIMQSYIGATAPAHRGLRTIVFPDFPIIISNNSVPNISVEFKRTDTALVDVTDVISAFITHFLQKNGYQTTDSAGLNYYPINVDIGTDDVCYGITITDRANALDKLVQWRGVYKYQIKDGLPLHIYRREVNSGLTINYTVDETDLVRRGGPAVSFTRVSPQELPSGMELQYSDPDNEYDMNVATASHEGSGTSRTIMSASTEFILDSESARELSFDILYKSRAEGLGLSFEMDDLSVETGDIIQINTNDGDNFVCLVEQQTQTKSRSSSIKALNLLTVAGTTISGDTYRDGGSAGKKKWPEDVLDWNFLVSGDRVFSIRDTGSFYIGMNSISTPVRKLSSSKWRDLLAKDPNGNDWGSGVSSGGASIMFEDSFYVYWLNRSAMVISRLLKTATNINTVETLVIPEGFYVDGIFGHDNQNSNGNDISVYKDGKLYVAWNGRWANSGTVNTNFLLVVVDIGAWSTTAFTAYNFYVPGSPATITPSPTGIAVTNNGNVVIAATDSSPRVGKYYYANLASLSSWAISSATFPADFNSFTSHGNIAYFGETYASGFEGLANRKHRLAVVDFTSGGFSETIVDLTSKDANFISLTRTHPPTMWTSDSHLFIYGNHTPGAGTPYSPDQREHHYVGRFDLGTVNAAGGKFLSELIYNENDLYVRRGHYFEGKNYLCMNAFDQSRDSFLVLSEDLTPEVMYPPIQFPYPPNDDFADASVISVGTAVKGNLTYASTEVGEPIPPYAGQAEAYFNNGHSVWYRFKAPASTTYTISAQQTGSPFSNSPIYGIVVYTGADVASLTYVTGVSGTFGSGPSTRTLSATAGVDYMISVRLSTDSSDAFGGAIGFGGSKYGKFSITIT